MSIAFDAVVQQLLTIEMQQALVRLPIENLTANYMLPYTTSISFSEETDIDPHTLVEVEVLIEGINQPNGSLPDVQCPSGDCSWPVTPTLGVCSECGEAPISITTSSNATCSFTNYTSNWTVGGVGEPVLPSLLSTYSCADNLTGTRSGSWWQLESNIWPLLTLSETYGKKSIAHVLSWGLAFDEMSALNPNMSSISAYNCTFYSCVQGFYANTTAGNIKQQRMDTIDCRANQIQIGTDVVTTFGHIPPKLNAGAIPSLNISQSWLASALGFTFLDSSASVNYSLTFSSDFGGGEVDYVPTIPLAVWMSSSSLSNISALMDGIARSLTTYMRTFNGTELNELYAPTVSIVTPLVRVRWAWLAYPLALLVSGLLFFILTVIATRRRQVRPWKGHRMPLLLADIHPAVRGTAKGGLSRRTGLDDRVGDVCVQLDFDGDDNIIFRKVGKSSTREELLNEDHLSKSRRVAA